jgi:hypothetical protein
MTERSTRIRWNQEERDTLLAAYRELRARNPRADMAELFADAQKALPPKRRRALDYKLRAWLASEGAGPPRHAAPAATAGTTAATVATPAEGAMHRPSDRSQAAPACEPSSPPGADAAASASPDAAAIARVLVERGSEIVADILASERVQQALRALLRAAWPAPGDAGASSSPEGAQRAAPGSEATEPARPPGNGRLQVLIAGLEQREAAALARTYDDTLALACWSAEDGLEQLQAALARADVVIGMTSLLSQPVEQTLRRHARRYVRNARGVAGLRSELADLALSGPAAAGAGGS